MRDPYWYFGGGGAALPNYVLQAENLPGTRRPRVIYSGSCISDRFIVHFARALKKPGPLGFGELKRRERRAPPLGNGVTLLQWSQ